MVDTSAAAFRRLDSDSDGRISAIEAADDPKVAALFTRADKDQDGYLSPDEFKELGRMANAANGGRPGDDAPGARNATSSKGATPERSARVPAPASAAPPGTTAPPPSKPSDTKRANSSP
jgi:hypothetical protein